jgi:hypothetical protein
MSLNKFFFLEKFLYEIGLGENDLLFIFDLLLLLFELLFKFDFVKFVDLLLLSSIEIFYKLFNILRIFTFIFFYNIF